MLVGSNDPTKEYPVLPPFMKETAVQLLQRGLLLEYSKLKQPEQRDRLLINLTILNEIPDTYLPALQVIIGSCEEEPFLHRVSISLDAKKVMEIAGIGYFQALELLKEQSRTPDAGKGLS